MSQNGSGGVVAALVSAGLVAGGLALAPNAAPKSVVPAAAPPKVVAPEPAKPAPVAEASEPKTITVPTAAAAAEPDKPLQKPAATEPKVAAAAEPDKPSQKPAPAEPVAAKVAPAPAGGKTDHAMFGGDSTRNMANLKDTNIVAKPEPEGPNLKWKAELGSRAYGGPTVAGGKVFVGTNNERPRNLRDQKKTADGDIEPIDKGILMCFDEKTGEFLWQHVNDKLPSGPVNDWPKEGVCSTPTVDGNRIYYVSNRCTVVCLDVNGLADGNQGVQTEKYADKTDADVIWEFDLMKEENVFPHNMSAGCPLIVGDLLYTVTANGVDEGHINIPSPAAPSFIALNKTTGKVVWKSNLPGKNVMHGQWSNPVYAELKGVKQIIFPGGDGWIYAFAPLTGELLWKFDGNPKDSKYELGGQGTRNDYIGTPVLWENKLIIGVGQDPEHFTGIGHLWCIDPAGKSGDISPKDTAFDPKDPKNAGTGLVWHVGGADARPLVPRDFSFGRTMSTASIVDGILYISELQGFLHCFDAATGKKYWQYDTKGAIWGSPYYVDGKVYLATEGGDLFVFKHDKSPKVIDELDNPTAKDQKEFRRQMLEKRKQVETASVLHKVEFDAPIRSTPIVANGVLYVMTEKTLYAFAAK